MEERKGGLDRPENGETRKGVSVRVALLPPNWNGGVIWLAHRFAKTTIRKGVQVQILSIPPYMVLSDNGSPSAPQAEY